MKTNAPRLIELEALRGIASVIVLVHHALLAFAPGLHGLVQPDSPYAIFGTPAFSLINGGAAVVLFFVLSGFVLTFRAMETGNAASLASAAVKRWPRLAIPAVASTLLAAGLMTFGLFAAQEAASLSGSLWLTWFFGWQSTGLEALAEGTRQGLFSVFLGQENSYNPNLWTMYYEFFGSFIAYGCAACVIHVRRPFLSIAFLIIAWLITMAFSPYFSTFILGVVLAKVYVTAPAWRLRLGWASIIACVSILLFGYANPLRTTPIHSDWYTLLRPFEGADAVPLRVLLHSIASLGFISLALWSPTIRAVLRAPSFIWLGRMSFPIYLVHISVICSLGARIYIGLFGISPVLASIAATSASILASFVVAYPFETLDNRWRSLLSRIPGPQRYSFRLSRSAARSNP